MRARACLSIVWAVASFDLEDRDTRYGTGIRAAATGAATKLLLAAYIGLGIAPLSEAAEPRGLHETMSVNSVRIEVIWIETQAEMDRKRREYGSRTVTDSVIKTALQGFSVLGRRDGELVCLVFSPKPERFDDNVNTTLGHELLHCFGFSHR
jgi:hypothetical protein